MAKRSGCFAVACRSLDDGYSVVVDDDGRTGYAYLRDPDENTIADVWLYNRAETPDEPEWDRRENAPFRNPKRYVHETLQFVLPRSADDISVDFYRHDDGRVGALVVCSGSMAGKLLDKKKPGWAAMAREHGPLALSLDGLFLDEQASEIDSFKDFERFLVQLSADFGKSSETWQNIDLSSYLGALVTATGLRCENMSDKDKDGVAPHTLRLVAELLLAARDYE